MALNKKYLDVIKYFLQGYSKTQSMLKAGYSSSTAIHTPHLVFDRPEVIKEIEKRKKNMIERNKLTEDYVIQKLMQIADFDIAQIMDVQEDGSFIFNMNKLTPALSYAISSAQSDVISTGRGGKAEKALRTKITTTEKLRALEMLGKYLGMFVEKVELSGDADLIKRLQAGRERVAKREEDVATSDPNYTE